MISGMIRAATVDDIAESPAVIRELAECEQYVRPLCHQGQRRSCLLWPPHAPQRLDRL